MFSIDFQTVFLIYFLTGFVGTILILMLFLETRKRFQGVGLMLSSFFIHTTCTLFILLRGVIPDFLSIVFSNTAAIFGAVLMLIGLEQFVAKRGLQIQNYLAILVFFIAQYYFTYIEPSLQIRSFIVSLTYLFISVQFIWLSLVRVSGNVRKFTRFLGIVYILFSLNTVFHLVHITLNPLIETNYLHAQLEERLFILITELIFLFYIFSLVLMFNKRLRFEIEFQEEKFSKAFHSSPSAYLITRLADGIIFEVNEGFCRMFEHKTEEVLDKTTSELKLWVHPEDQQSVRNQLTSRQKVIKQEFNFRIKSGAIITGLFSAENILINNETCVISVINDITYLKNTEKVLEEQKKELKELVATKDKFFSIIAHDLRSPFSSMLGFSELLKDNVTDLNQETIQEYAQIIHNSAEKTYSLLENLLQWARIQQGKIQFTPENLTLKNIADDTFELVQENVMSKKLQLIRSFPDSIKVFADKNMLKTILRNLVSNAIKFTAEGGTIEFGALQVDKQIEIFVQDTGLGIKPENIARLFLKNSDFTTSGTNNEKGTGLGLILCNEFVQQHGGIISVTSEIGKGSRFSFRISAAN